MADRGSSTHWLPGALIVLGLLSLVGGGVSGGPDLVGGIVFALLSWAAAGAILYRRDRDARAASRNEAEVDEAERGADR